MTGRPTARGVGTTVIVAVTAAAGATFHSHALLLLAGATVAVAVAAVGTGAVLAHRRVVAFTQAAPALVAAGSPSTVVVTATGIGATVRADRAQGRWRNLPGSSAGLAEAAATPGPGWLAPAPGALDSLSAAKGGGLQSSTPVPTGTRGVLVLPGRRLWAHDPLGLIGVVVATVPPVSVVVHPAPAPVGVEATRPAGVAAATLPAATPGGTGGSGELDGVRPYVAGDPLHLVHWPSLARPGPPLVKEFGADGGVERCVFVDDRAGVHSRQSFESMLAAACGLVVTGWHAGVPVVLTTWSGGTTIVGDSTADLAQAMVVLASMTPRAGRGADPPRGPVITITSQVAVSGLPASLAGTGALVAVP